MAAAKKKVPLREGVAGVSGSKERAALKAAAEHDDIREAINLAARRMRAQARDPSPFPPTFEEDVHAIWLMTKGVAQDEAARRGARKTHEKKLSTKGERDHASEARQRGLSEKAVSSFWKWRAAWPTDSDRAYDEMRLELGVSLRELQAILAKLRKGGRILRHYRDPINSIPH